MNEIIQTLVDDEFFAPVQYDLIDNLILEYNTKLERINNVADIINSEINGPIMSYFLDGNSDRNHGGISLKRGTMGLFDPNGAKSALDSAYWSKTMQLTDVFNYMPQKRRDEWNESIRNMSCPSYEEDTVRTTMNNLLNMRSQFLSERVDGIFRGLSGEHVTNQPQAFGKRMIVGYVLNEWHHVNYSKCGLINDLRCVIAKFMGRDEPQYRSSDKLIESMKRNWGQWVTVDGGALKIRVYKKGTAHIEVHPDMAWRLNAILANLYPMAIPASFRTKPNRKVKEIELMQKPLPFSVIDILAGMSDAIKHIKTDNHWQPYKHEKIKNAKQFSYEDKDKHLTSAVVDILTLIGGVKHSDGYFEFDYDPTDVINDIVNSGCVPDFKSHQYYPTPKNLAEKAVELAELKSDDSILEPSAGQGGIADVINIGKLTCVEVSKLQCKILEEKGYNVIHNDFLKWVESDGEHLFYDKIIMNPPFSEGRWKAHLEAAFTKLKTNGKLIAILPSSTYNKQLLKGINHEYYGPFDNEFSGTSVSVVIVILTK